MYEWQSWAKLGFWNYLDAVDCISRADPQEMETMKSILSEVVPMIRVPYEGDGPLGAKRRATSADDDALIQHIKRGEYSKCLKRISARLDALPPPEHDEDFPPSAKMKREVELVGGHLEFELLQLRWAASQLHILLEGLPIEPKLSWLDEAKETAYKAIENEGINFQTLDMTYVQIRISPLKKTTKSEENAYRDGIWQQVEQPVGAFTIRDLTDTEGQWLETRLFHAANLLLAASSVERTFDLLPPKSDNLEPSDPHDVAAHMLEVCENAASVGFHLRALNDKRFMRLAQSKAKQNKPLGVRNQAVKSENASRDEYIYREVQKVLDQQALEGKKVNILAAAKKVLKDNGLDIGVRRIREIYQMKAN